MGKTTTRPDKQEAKSADLHFTIAFLPKLLICLVIVLALINLAVQYMVFYLGFSESSHFVELFDMDVESSVPSIFSVLLLFCSFLLLLIISLLKMKERGTHLAGWFILALGFLTMTFDEGASIHEKLMRPINQLLMYEDIPSVFYFTWVIPAILLIALLALVYIKFIIDLPGKTRWSFLLSAAIYLGGAVGAELVSGYYAGKFGTDNLGFNLMAAGEEIMEMSGLILFMWALLTYISEQYGEIQLAFSSRKTKQ
jgi:hypothetical protein